MDRTCPPTTSTVPSRSPAARALVRIKPDVARACLLPLLLALGACGAGSGDDDPIDPIDTPRDPDSTPPPVVEPDPTDPSPDEDVLPRADVRGLDAVVPYVRDGRYADVLARCSLIGNVNDACPLSTLPFISQEMSAPTVEDVMARVLVTHDWMGERFEALLRSRSDELLPLFGSVTSVLIGSTVRPSNYWTGTGGIQLDPAGLWLTREEKANISIEEDYRAQFRVLLGFRNLWTMQVDGESIFGRFGLEDDSERELADIERPMMSLLFHELAHAIDYLPPGLADSLDSSLIPDDALDRIADARLSRDLDARLPLNSRLLTGLARVRFRGEEPTEQQRAVSGAVAGAEMAFDGATHFYSYHTDREDFAQLFEVVQMKRLYDADVHVAFSVQPDDPEDFGCDDLLVEWGVLNRLGDPTVRLRAQSATEAIYGPDPTLVDFLATLQGTETPMDAGVDWCTNLEKADEVVAATRSRAVDAGADAIDAWPSHAERHAIVDARRRPGASPAR